MRMDRVLRMVCEVLPGTCSNNHHRHKADSPAQHGTKVVSHCDGLSLPLSLVQPSCSVNHSQPDTRHSFFQSKNSSLVHQPCRDPCCKSKSISGKTETHFSAEGAQKHTGIHNAVPLSEGFLGRCQSTGDLRSVRLLSLFVQSCVSPDSCWHYTKEKLLLQDQVLLSNMTLVLFQLMSLTECTLFLIGLCQLDSFPFLILSIIYPLSNRRGTSSVLEWSAGSKPAKKSLMFQNYEECFRRWLLLISLVYLSLWMKIKK